MPIMSVMGRKQIHITSHQPASWVNKVVDIVDERTGKSAYHVIDQRFKCRAHQHLDSLVCPCQAVYCPSHVDINSSLQALINLIAPGGDIELTGGGVTTNAGERDTFYPFSPDIVKMFLSNVYDLTREAIKTFYICMDPTYSTGTQSSIGIATYAELANGIMVVFGLEEVPVTDIATCYYNLYSCLLLTHLRMIADFRKDQDVVFVPEANTFMLSNTVVFQQFKQQARARYGVDVKVYVQYVRTTQRWDIGKLVSGNKTHLVTAMHNAILHSLLGRSEVVLSAGHMIRDIFVSERDRLQALHGVPAKERAPDPPSEAAAPRTAADVFALTPQQCVDHVFRVLTGKNVRIDRFSPVMSEAGEAMLTKLTMEMAEVTVRKSTNKVSTGGKKGKGALEYSRDDLFSAALLGATITSDKTAVWQVQSSLDGSAGRPFADHHS